ncbi:response regulator [Pseudomarimonas salicorniae]|uniref:Response regulator n=1 Tax=Pseudomarimonas salicorniae TaxID=2933270 RepID=A0ABT0GK14_9GAMM|nr:response regulator [Lysobacter sp. CAU 1642]MCK7594707.1 response regulator [Lysobacter sp. CAU 1642]
MSSTAKPGLFRRLFGGTESFVERRRRPRSPPPDGTRALIIDDSNTVLAVLGKMLRQNGYLTSTAQDAESGIQLARSERPDVVFLDIVLPGMNGFAALRALKRDPETRDIPVIMMSGNMQATEQFYAQRIGADSFLKKPFPRAELFSHLERLLDASRLPTALDDGDPGPSVVDNSEGN